MNPGTKIGKILKLAILGAVLGWAAAVFVFMCIFGQGPVSEAVSLVLLIATGFAALVGAAIAVAKRRALGARARTTLIGLLAGALCAGIAAHLYGLVSQPHNPKARKHVANQAVPVAIPVGCIVGGIAGYLVASRKHHSVDKCE